MELRQIVQFVTVAELRSFRRAAERLHMSQPPLSQAIRRLETDLSVRLFERTTRSVELTEAGKVFLAESRRVLAGLDAAVIEAQRTAQGQSGRLTIGFTAPWAYDVIPTVLRRFRLGQPKVVLALREMRSSLQIQSLLNKSIDVAFLRLPARARLPGIQTVTLRKDRLAVVMPKNHPLAGSRTVALTSLQNELFILPPFPADPEMDEYSFRTQIVELCRKARFTPRISQEASQMQTIACLVETGFGISLIPKWASRHFSSGIVYRDLDGDRELSRVTLVVAWEAANNSPVLKRFIETVTDGRR